MNAEQFYENLLSLPNLCVISFDISSNRISFDCSYTKDSCVCPNCQETTAIINQYEFRKVQDLRISGKEVWLHIRLPQFVCIPCNRYFTAQPDWLLKGKSYTKRQAKWIFCLCEQQPFKQVACLVNLSVGTVESLYYNIAKSSINLSQDYAKVRKLGIDEISHKKGKNAYLCVLTDLESGTHLDILPNRKKETLMAHFQSLGAKFCEQIEVVSCDMWSAYIHLSKEIFPNAKVVIDRFHLVKSMNEVLDYIRRKLRKNEPAKEAFKFIKWDLFKRPEKLSRTNRVELDKAFAASPILEEAYELRNTFNAMFDVCTTDQVLETHLNQWLVFAKKLSCKPLNKFIKTVERWKSEIITFASQRITNAVTESSNNKIRCIKRMAFGMPKFENLRIRVLAKYY